MKLYFTYFLFLSLFFVACQEKTQSNEGKAEGNPNAMTVANEEKAKVPTTFAEKVEATHKKDLFLGKDLIAYDLDLWFGGKKRTDARIIMATNSTRIRMELDNGKTLIYNGEKVYQVGDTSVYRSARFDIFTWPYFFAFPFKLTDPGTNWEAIEYNTLNEQEYLSEKLTFDAGTGDAPKDWYIAYADQESYQLYCAAYIVTLGRTQEKGEEDPHAITYTDYRMISGVPMATKWEFWSWRWEKGITDQLGRAEISNISFMDMDESLFEVKELSKEITL